MALSKIVDRFLRPPMWPMGFVAANLLFAVIAIISVLVLIHDQRLAIRSAKLQEYNFARYRNDFDKATHVKVKLLQIIARKLDIPENDIEQAVEPLPNEIN